MHPDPEYIYSQCSAESVRHLVAANFALVPPLRCQFYVLGLHDNYLVEDGNKKYILRIYRNDWRTAEEALFELELLSCLAHAGAPVAGPVPMRTGELAFQIESPEGMRMAALFHYAAGDAPAEAITSDECSLLGRAVAQVHLHAEAFHTTRRRQVLDMPYLLDESIAILEPFMDAEGLACLTQYQKTLHAILPGLQQEAGVYGICAGDINPRNFHIDHNKQITLFDFDQCGYGYRAFEIGKFASSLHAHKLKNALVSAFMEGYQQLRSLSDAERSVIPGFEMLSVIWVMAINARNANRIGHKYLGKPFWNRKLAVLKALHGKPYV